MTLFADQTGPGCFIVTDVEPDGVVEQRVWARSAALAIEAYQQATSTTPMPTPSDVVRERDRRLALGFDYDFNDERGTHRIGTTEADMKGWDEVSKASLAAVLLGAPGTPIDIVTETGPVTLTAIEWQQIIVRATQVRQSIWHASFTLQVMQPIPETYADDVWWAGN